MDIKITNMPKPNLKGVIRAIRDLVKKSTNDPAVRDIAIFITQQVQADETGHPDRRNYQALAETVYNFIRREIQYVRDPFRTERIADAITILKQRAGDCDDQVVLGASLLASLGVPVRFVTIATNPAMPRDYTHIYFEYNYNGEWLPFDTTIDAQAGYLPEWVNDLPKKVWTLSGNAVEINQPSDSDLSGCSSCGLSDGNLGSIWGAVAGSAGKLVDVVSGGPKQRARAARDERAAAEAYLEATRTRNKNMLYAGGVILIATFTGIIIYRIT
ncbi:MAG: transglutaminase-like domain-containing protein [Balneolales bacterium]|nr:transglutaminase-like domain-containing protein [Balneolales bacterium]